MNPVASCEDEKPPTEGCSSSEGSCAVGTKERERERERERTEAGGGGGGGEMRGAERHREGGRER